DHLVFDELERPAPEFRRHSGFGILGEARPDRLEARPLGAAGRAVLQVSGELAARRLVGLPGQLVDGAGRQFAAFHEASPSEKRDFRASTARNMRVLTAPTEMPSTSAISA